MAKNKIPTERVRASSSTVARRTRLVWGTDQALRNLRQVVVVWSYRAVLPKMVIFPGRGTCKLPTEEHERKRHRRTERQRGRGEGDAMDPSPSTTIQFTQFHFGK